ncbi:MAG TPA: nickel/cobalt transporter [Modicisalibacter sp.]|nr:nickel/cobalt transporter [Modicisalibacter sp.]
MRELIYRSPGLAWGVGLATLAFAIVVMILMLGADSGLVARMLSWQRELHRGLTLAIMQLSSAPSTATWATLLGASFGYGIFHAAGPGHGKAVLSTYLVSQGGAVRQALLLSVTAALLQALVAIALVALLVHGLGWLTREAMGSVVWVERVSFAMVALLGLWLCFRALRQLLAAYRPRVASHETHAHHHNVHYDHHDACGCNHEHHVDPTRIGNWRTGVVAVFAIGLRPCSGGVLVLSAASLLSQFWTGVAAVLAMAVGTALAVSGLALASVMARGWAERHVVARASGRGTRRLLGWVALAGGLFIVTLGVSLSVGVTTDDGSPLLSAPTDEAPRSPFSR